MRNYLRLGSVPASMTRAAEPADVEIRRVVVPVPCFDPSLCVATLLASIGSHQAAGCDRTLDRHMCSVYEALSLRILLAPLCRPGLLASQLSLANIGIAQGVIDRLAVAIGSPKPGLIVLSALFTVDVPPIRSGAVSGECLQWLPLAASPTSLHRHSAHSPYNRCNLLSHDYDRRTGRHRTGSPARRSRRTTTKTGRATFRGTGAASRTSTDRPRRRRSYDRLHVGERVALGYHDRQLGDERPLRHALR